MKSIEWIELLIETRKLPSHRQAALLIGMAEPLMSKHRNGKAVTLDDKYAYRLEELLGLPHGRIVLDQHAERERDPNIAAMWRKLAGMAAAVLVTFFALGSAPNPAVAAGKNIVQNQLVNIDYAQLCERLRRAITSIWQALKTLTILQYSCRTGVLSHGF